MYIVRYLLIDQWAFHRGAGIWGELGGWEPGEEQKDGKRDRGIGT